MLRVEIRRPEDLGLAVSEARHSAGLTQVQLSRLSGVERTYLAKIESGVSTLLVVRLLNLLRRLDARLIVELPGEPEGPGGDPPPNVSAHRGGN